MSHREGDGAPTSGLAPVTYLPGVVPAREIPARWTIPLEDGDSASDGCASELPVSKRSVSTRPAAERRGPTFAETDADTDDDSDDDADATNVSQTDAEEALARRLRRSALSEREARTFLAQRGVDSHVVEDAITHFIDRRWLDDAALAEQLVYAGTSRKAQGRRAIAQALNGRGIARDVADAALAALPDDDEDRAIEYARTKAHGLRSYDVDTAVRRLVGQLSRRGYPGSVASTAARTAINELRGGSSGGPHRRSTGGGVQFR